MALPKVPYDAEMAAILSQIPTPAVLGREMIQGMRDGINSVTTAEIVLADQGVDHVERTIPGPHGDITLSILTPKGKAAPKGGRPGIYNIHGGGYLVGNRFFGLGGPLEMVRECNAVCVTVEYRLAPEHPHPVPADDCYAGLVWVGEHTAELGINASKLMITGQSAGGGLAAACALMARDKGGPALCAQLLTYPMLDDRMETVSAKQYPAEGTWSNGSNEMAWKCLLGDNRQQVSIYAAPGRATDLSNLPPTFIEVATAEVFRDENSAYASKLWAAGIQCEFHAWPGAFHGYDMMAPTAELSKISMATRLAWVKRTLVDSSEPSRPKL
jgi:acetyl esterase/lipase